MFDEGCPVGRAVRRVDARARGRRRLCRSSRSNAVHWIITRDEHTFDTVSLRRDELRRQCCQRRGPM